MVSFFFGMVVLLSYLNSTITVLSLYGNQYTVSSARMCCCSFSLRKTNQNRDVAFPHRMASIRKPASSSVHVRNKAIRSVYHPAMKHSPPNGEVLGALSLTSEFGEPNSVLAATRDIRLASPSKHLPGTSENPKNTKNADPLSAFPRTFLLSHQPAVILTTVYNEIDIHAFILNLIQHQIPFSHEHLVVLV